MPTRLKLTGQKFNRWHVLRLDRLKGKKCSYWICKCICGKVKSIRGPDLVNGSNKSCGCLHSEDLIKRNTKHSEAAHHVRTRTYRIWQAMLVRCYNSKVPNYKHYGGRNIKVCARWKKYSNFKEDMGVCPSNQHSIDRIDNNKNYFKTNCKWSTQKEQTRNTRVNRLISFNGKTQCLAAWEEELGLSESLLSSRLAQGWSISKALTTLPRKLNAKCKNS